MRNKSLLIALMLTALAVSGTRVSAATSSQFASGATVANAANWTPNPLGSAPLGASDSNCINSGGTPQWAEFTFPAFSIPAADVINGIEVIFDYQSASSSNRAQLKLSGVNNGAERTIALQGGASNCNGAIPVTAGGAADVWGSTLTVADFNAGNVSVRFIHDATTVLIDSVELKVTHTAGVDNPPAADAGGPYSGAEGAAIALDASGSSDDNGITTYEWDCTDNGSFDVSSANPTGSSCTYSDDGSFTVRLRVTDTAAQTHEDTATVTVANVDPAITSVSNDGPIVEGGSATVTVAATDVAADPLSYSFDCDNDTVFEVGPQAGNSTSCTFGDDGTFTVPVRVDDGDTGTASGSTVVTVTNANPTITSVTNDGPIVEGGSATVTVAATDVAADTLSYSFDCDNDTVFEVGPQAGNSTSCAFDDDGTFTVPVRVDDEDTGTASGSTVVTVTNADPTVDAAVDPVVVDEGDPAANNGTFADVGDDTVTISVTGAGSVSQVGTQSGTWSWSFASTDGPNESQTITITADDGEGGTSTVDFTLTVNNVAPTATPNSYATLEDTALPAGNVITDDSGSGVDSDPGADTLTVVAFDNPSAGGGTVSIAANGDLTYHPADNFCGLDTFDYTIDDDEGATSSATVTIDVTCVNDPPSFTEGADESIDEDAGPQVVAGWATALSTGPANESGQTLTAFDIVGNSSPAIFLSGPTVDPATGDLSYEIKPDRTGVANIGLTLSDDGGTANGGSDTSEIETFKITVAPVNDPPSFDNVGDVTREAGTGQQSVAWASAVVAGPPNEAGQAVAFVVTSTSCTPGDLLNAGPTVDPDGTLRFTPKDGATGSCAISVKLIDNCGAGSPPPSCGVSGVSAESAIVGFTLTLVSATPPDANSQSVATDGGNPLAINLTGVENGGGAPLSFQVLEPVTDADTGEIISDTGPYFGTLDTTTPPTNVPDGLNADVVYTPDQPLITNAAVIAKSSFVLEKFADILSGDVVVNNSGGTATLDRSTTTPAGFSIKSDSISAHNTAAINGDAFCNGGNFAGNCDPLAPLPVFEALPPFKVGSTNSNHVTVAGGSPVTLTPGIYGNVTVNQDGVLSFAPGKYSMASLTTGKKAELKFSGPTEVKIAGRFVTNSNNSVGASGLADQVVFYVAGTDTGGAAVSIGFNNAAFFATVYADNGTINVGQDSAVTGALLAKHVVIESKSTVALSSGFSERTDQFAFEVTDQSGLVSEQAIVQINADDACRDASGQIVAIAAFPGNEATDGANSIQVKLRGCESTDVPVTFALVQNGSVGSVTGLPSGPVGPPYEFDVTYTPADPVPNLRDAFVFSMSNGASTVQATVDINEPPCAVVDAVDGASIATDENNPLTIQLSGCDPDNLTLSFATIPAGGPPFGGCATCALSLPTAVVDNRPGFSSANVVFTHDELVTTSVSFTFTASSLNGVDSGAYTIEVNPQNVAPTANDDSTSVPLGGLVTGGVLGNDTDPNGDALTATLVGPGPSYASAFELNPDGSFAYTHDGSANFSDSFTYEASDGALSDTATVSITIVAANITVMVEKSGPAGSEDSLITSIPSGVSCGIGCLSDSFSYMTTENIRLQVSTATGFVFTGWSGDADCIDGNIIPIADRSCIANFATDTTTPPTGDPIELTVQKAGNGGDGVVRTTPAGINCGVGCSSQTVTMSGDPRIVLIARAAPGSIFTGFAGGAADDCVDGELQAVIDTTCSATFDVAGRTLTLLFAGDGGSVSSDPGGISCGGEPCSAQFGNGTTVLLSARPDSAGATASWSGPCIEDTSVPDGRRATVLMTADATCTVTFTN